MLPEEWRLIPESIIIQYIAYLPSINEPVARNPFQQISQLRLLSAKLWIAFSQLYSQPRIPYL